jgi:hypothetical protein
MFVKHLYDYTAAQLSPVGPAFSTMHCDHVLWSLLCDEADLPLAHHRQAFYLRTCLALPGLFYTIPDCRFCDTPEGSIASHLHVCPALYARLTNAFHRLLPILCHSLNCHIAATRDHVACLRQSAHTLLFLLIPDGDPHRLFAHIRHLTCTQIICLTWSGQWWCLQTHHLCPPTTIRLQMCKNLLRDMAQPCPYLNPPLPTLSFGDPVFLSLCTAYKPPSWSLTCLLAWLVRIDPRLYAPQRCHDPWIPPVCTAASTRRYILALTCLTPQCWAAQPPPAITPYLIICDCPTPLQPHLGQSVFLAADHFIIIASPTYTSPFLLVG